MNLATTKTTTATQTKPKWFISEYYEYEYE